MDESSPGARSPRARFIGVGQSARIFLLIVAVLALLLVVAVAILTRQHTTTAEERFRAAKHAHRVLKATAQLEIALLRLDSSELRSEVNLDRIRSDIKAVESAFADLAKELSISDVATLRQLISRRLIQKPGIDPPAQNERGSEARTDAIRQRLETLVRSTEANLMRDQDALWHVLRVLKIAGFSILLIIAGITVFGVICFLRCDRDGEHERVKQLEGLLTSAESAIRVKSAFVSTVSHELRTPMTGLSSVIELLETSPPLTHDQQELIVIMKTSLQLMLRLINDILLFSKMEAGRLSLVPQPVDLARFLGLLSQTCRAQAENKRVAFVTHLPADLPHRLLVDPDRLRQVLVNLCDNAFKFTPTGGRVQLHVARVTSESNDHKQRAANASVALMEFRVSDTGIGIPHDKLADIFLPFTQATHTTSQQYGGTGLGLTISSQLVQLMGGQLQVTSERGRGSTFWFTIPCTIISEDAKQSLTDLRSTSVELGAAQVSESASALEMPRIVSTMADSSELKVAPSSSAAISIGSPLLLLQPPPTQLFPDTLPLTAASPMAAEQKTTGGLQVLLVEDSGIVQKVMTRMLNSLGHTVTIATHGAEALSVLFERKTAFDVVLMDVQMPVMDGLTAAREIRKWERQWHLNAAEPASSSVFSSSTHIPIVAVTADDSDPRQAECRQSEIDYCLGKPVTRREVEVVLQSVLPRLKRLASIL